MDAKKRNKRKRNNRKYDLQNQIIQKKNDEIEALRNKVLKLEIDRDEKQELLESVDYLRIELKDIVEDLKKKKEEYDRLNEDLMKMRTVFNQEVFRSRWRIVKWLIK